MKGEDDGKKSLHSIRRNGIRRKEIRRNGKTPVILQTGQFADAASNSIVVCFCGYFETPKAAEYENANNSAYSKTKAYKCLQSVSYFKHIYSHS